MQTATERKTLGGLDDLLSTDANDIQYREVQAWGKTYGMLNTTAAEVLEWLEEKEQPGKGRDASLRLLARSFVNADRSRVCDTPEKVERMVEAMRGKDSKTVNKLLAVVIEMNGIATEKAEAAKNA